MKRNIIVISSVILVVIVAVIWVAARYINSENRLVIEGVVECRTYRASSKLAGRIDSLFVREGDYVRKGQLLYTISTPELEAKLGQVAALEAEAEAMNREVERGARKEQIAAIKNQWQKAVVGRDLAEKSYLRVKNLYDKGVVPRQQYDEALANYEAMVATASSAKAEYELVIEGATSEQKESVAAKVRQAQAAVREVDAYISDARVYAPISGPISNIISEPGELISSGYPVATILDLGDIWASFNIRESDLHALKLGDTFTAFVPALDSSVRFEVYYISSEADFATWRATRARGGFDIRTFEVRARPIDANNALLPGMSVVLNGNRL